MCRVADLRLSPEHICIVCVAKGGGSRKTVGDLAENLFFILDSANEFKFNACE